MISQLLSAIFHGSAPAATANATGKVLTHLRTPRRNPAGLATRRHRQSISSKPNLPRHLRTVHSDHQTPHAQPVLLRPRSEQLLPPHALPHHLHAGVQLRMADRLPDVAERGRVAPLPARLEIWLGMALGWRDGSQGAEEHGLGEGVHVHGRGAGWVAHARGRVFAWDAGSFAGRKWRKGEDKVLQKRLDRGLVRLLEGVWVEGQNWEEY